jgi:hypothetical protein
MMNDQTDQATASLTVKPNLMKKTLTSGPDYILNFEVHEVFRFEADSLDYVGKFLRRKRRVVRALHSCNAEFPGREDQRCGSWLAKPHYDSRESSRIVLGVSTLERDFFQIQANPKACGARHVLDSNQQLSRQAVACFNHRSSETRSVLRWSHRDSPNARGRHVRAILMIIISSV